MRAFLLAMLLMAGPARADIPVDVELVLAVDVSGSMDLDEQALQRAGYVAAITHPDVLGAIGSGLHGRIALTYLEWAGPEMQRVVVPWAIVEDSPTAAAFAARLDAAPLGTMRGTAIADGLLVAAALFNDNGYAGERQVIDVSGDGPNNMGEPVVVARDAVLSQGIIINGLPIMLKDPNSGFGMIRDLDRYYENCVIGGPGAFIVPVDDPRRLVEAIRRKMVLEIADAGPDAGAAMLARPVADPAYDCMIGERQRRMWMDR